MIAVACPDKFRGSLDAPAAATAMGDGLRAAGYEVREIPLADGGEGSLDVVLAATGGTRKRARVTGPLGKAVDADWAMLGDRTAVIESAAASGLALLDGPNDPLRASSRGTGELIGAAIRAGARQMVVCVGGSAMTDGGLGALDALGWSLGNTEVRVACDVDVTYLEAARIFGPQKGATGAQVELLTRRLQRLSDVLRDRTGIDVTELPGGGAAGGLGGGLAALGAQLVSGFDAIADAVRLDDALDGADLVLTGEGRLDPSSFEGKVVGGVLGRAAALSVPNRGIIVGQVDAATEFPDGVAHRALVDLVPAAGEAFVRAAQLITQAAEELGRGAKRGA